MSLEIPTNLFGSGHCSAHDDYIVLDRKTSMYVESQRKRKTLRKISGDSLRSWRRSTTKDHTDNGDPAYNSADKPRSKSPNRTENKKSHKHKSKRKRDRAKEQRTPCADPSPRPIHRVRNYSLPNVGFLSQEIELDVDDLVDLTPEEIDLDTLISEQQGLQVTPCTSTYRSFICDRAPLHTLPGWQYHVKAQSQSPLYRKTEKQLCFCEEEEEVMTERGISEDEVDTYFLEQCRRQRLQVTPTGSKSLDHGLDTIEEFELYSFEEYDCFDRLRPSPAPCHHHTYDNAGYLHEEMPELPSHGREFVRSKTWGSIPVHQLLSPQEIQQKYSSNKDNISLHENWTAPGSLQKLAQDDSSLKVPTSHRSRFAEWKSSRTRPSKSTRGTAWILGDDEDEAFSGGGASNTPRGSGSSHVSPTGNPQLFYTTPPRAQMATTQTGEERSRLERSGSSKGGGLSRLARRLSQKERRNTEERRRALRQRSVSLDCGDGRRALNSSMLEPPAQDEQSLSIPASPSLPTKLGKNSSSPNLAGRLSRKSSASRSRKSTSESLDASMSRDKRKRSTLDLQALFDAVEHQDMEKAKEVLDNNALDINGTTEEDLSALDVAVMTNHVPMAKMLLMHGAKENKKFESDIESREMKLVSLISDAERRVTEIRGYITNGSVTNNNTGTQQKEMEKQLSHWEFRHKLLKRMKTGLDNTRPPEVPTNIQLHVMSSSALLVRFEEPVSHNGAVVTRYRVEWSCFEDFLPLAGEHIIDDPHCHSHQIPDLATGNVYYVRVRAWNIKGFGEAASSLPGFAVPSSWREIDDTKPRGHGKLQLLNDLFVNMKNSRPADASEIKDSYTPSSSPLHPRKSNMRKSIKNLFSSAPKFQKSLKRGVYIACLMCSEDKILVTAEENLPILEVDDNFSSSTLNSDFHWLMKIACTWEDVKSLRQDMDKSSSSGNVQFRSKLLQTVGQLQSALGIQDLGRLFHQPHKDANGSVVFITVNSIKDVKSINTAHVKWMSYSKIQKKIGGTETISTPEALLNCVPEMLRYQQSSTQTLPRGLYLGYLKLKSTVDLIRILVPEKAPNVLPYTRIRDLSNITKEEWSWLRCLSRNEIHEAPTPAQEAFQSDLATGCKKLLQQLGIDEDEAVSHRLYDIEVIEMSDDITFLLVLPPAEHVCSVPGHHEEITQQPNFFMLPVQVFEMIHMMTYQGEFISRYTRLSSILEMDTHLAQQAQREAFSSEEVDLAKERLEQLAGFQQKLDEIWRGMRWSIDIITYARDKSIRGGLPLGILYAPPQSPTDSPMLGRSHFGILTSSSNSDVASSACSDCGYHSDLSSTESHGNRDGCQCNAATQESTTQDVWTHRAQQPGILRVYAAYETGLTKGTSVKLHVTPRTTSREVIDLVVQQLNKAVLSKGLDGPVYSAEDLEEFCLVAVIGARERVMREDYQPLQLQNPWIKGRLYVRLKSNLLAAIEQGQVTTV